MEPHRPSHQHCFSVSPLFKCQWPWVGLGVLAQGSALPHQASAHGTQSPSQRYPYAPRRAGHTPPAATIGSALAERAGHIEQGRGHRRGRGATGPAPEQPAPPSGQGPEAGPAPIGEQGRHSSAYPSLGSGLRTGGIQVVWVPEGGPPCLTQGTHTGVHAQGCLLGHTWEWWDGRVSHEPAPKPKRKVWGEHSSPACVGGISLSTTGQTLHPDEEFTSRWEAARFGL